MTTDYTTRKTWVESLIWDHRRDQPNPPTPGNPMLASAIPEEGDDVEH